MRIVRFTAAPNCKITDEADTLRLYADGEGERGALTNGVGDHAWSLGDIKIFTPKHDLSSLTKDDAPLAEAIRRGDAKRPRRVTILVHGFEFEPRLGFVDDLPTQPNPHNAIFHDREPDCEEIEHEKHETPWFSRLDAGPQDMVVPFAYASDPGFMSHRYVGPQPIRKLRGYYNRCVATRRLGDRRENLFAYGYAKAGAAGLCVAAIITQLTKIWGEEGIKIDIVAHSLGARVVTSALRRLTREYRTEPGINHIDQVILLAAALSKHQVSALGREVWQMAREGMRTPSFQIFNFSSKSDRLLRFVGAPLADRIGARIERNDGDPSRAFGLIARNCWRWRRRPIVGVDGGGSDADWLNWIDIPLDHSQVRDWGRISGLDLAGELKSCRLDHWVHYTHRDNWKLYRAILTDKADWTIDAIRTGRSSGSGRAIRPPLTARADEFYEPVRWTPDMSLEIDRSKARAAGLT